jgi:hypothetical protein
MYTGSALYRAEVFLKSQGLPHDSDSVRVLASVLQKFAADEVETWCLVGGAAAWNAYRAGGSAQDVALAVSRALQDQGPTRTCGVAAEAQ